MNSKKKSLTPEEIEQIAHDQSSPSLFGGESRMDKRSESEYSKAIRENGPYLTLGIQMAVTIAMFAGIGWWIGEKTGNDMWLGIGAGTGAVLGLGYFIMVVLRMEKKKPQKKK